MVTEVGDAFLKPKPGIVTSEENHYTRAEGRKCASGFLWKHKILNTAIYYANSCKETF